MNSGARVVWTVVDMMQQSTIETRRNDEVANFLGCDDAVTFCRAANREPMVPRFAVERSLIVNDRTY